MLSGDDFWKWNCYGNVKPPLEATLPHLINGLEGEEVE